MMTVVAAGIAPGLKAAGYRKQGFKFHQKASPTVVRLVNLQSSQWNSGSDGRFTVNLGVYHRDLAALHDTIPVFESPLVHQCIVQRRLGFLMPCNRDFWWTINNKANLAALSAGVALSWSKYGKSWLESNSSLAGARKFFLASKSHFLAAMASLAMGERTEAEKLLAAAIRDAPLLKERIDAWRRVHLSS